MNDSRMGVTCIVAFALFACGDPAGSGTSKGHETEVARQELLLESPTQPMISAGFDHVLALHSDGTVFAWGSNEAGQLGDGTTEPRARPIAVAIDNVIAVAAGNGTSFAIDADHVLWAWGANSGGLLGLGWDMDIQLVPVSTGLTDIAQVALSWHGHALALRSDGTVLAWGGANLYGNLGLGHSQPVQLPTVIPTLSDVVAIAAMGYSSYAVTADGRLWAWGDGWVLGRGPNVQNAHGPVLVETLANVETVFTGGGEAVARTSDGTYYGWGHNDAGELGNHRTQPSYRPQPLPWLDNSIAYSLSTSNSFSVRPNGIIRGAGGDATGLLGDRGDPYYSADPVTIPKVGNAVAVGANWYAGLAILAEGTVRSWGLNHKGNLLGWGDTRAIVRSAGFVQGVDSSCLLSLTDPSGQVCR